MPVAEGLPAIAIGLTILLLLMLAYAYDATIGALLRAIASFFDGIKTPGIAGFGSVGLGFIGSAARGLDNHIRQALATAINSTEWAWHKLVHWNAYAWQEVSGAVADLAEQTEQGFLHLVNHKIAAIVSALLSGAESRLAVLEAEVGALEHRVDPRIAEAVQAAHTALAAAEAAAVAVEHEAAAIPGQLAAAERGAFAKIRAVKGSIAAAVAAGFAEVWPRIRGIEGEADSLRKRIGQLVRTLTPAGIVGLVAGAVIAELKLGWLKCSNVDRTARALCGLDHDLLDAVLLGTAAVVGEVGLVEFAKAVQGITVDASDAIHTFYGVK